MFIVMGGGIAMTHQKRCHSTEDEAEDISAEICRLLPKAETGEQFAHICLLESRYVELTGKQLISPV
jgi:hypothetical protein